MKKNKKSKMRIRNVLIILGILLALGLSIYFGLFDGLQQTAFGSGVSSSASSGGGFS